MTDTPPLRPCDRHDLLHSIAHGMRYEGKRRIHHADNFMARVAAEKLLKHLEESGYVILQKPPAAAPKAPL